MIKYYTDDNGNLVYINQPDIERTLFPQVDVPEPTDIIVDPTETDVEIDGEAGKRYICGELDSLEITPPDSGLIDVVFTSGETPTDVDIPETVIFNQELTISADTIYEISILNGTLGAWLSWPAPVESGGGD